MISNFIKHPEEITTYYILGIIEYTDNIWFPSSNHQDVKGYTETTNTPLSFSTSQSIHESVVFSERILHTMLYVQWPRKVN